MRWWVWGRGGGLTAARGRKDVLSDSIEACDPSAMWPPSLPKNRLIGRATPAATARFAARHGHHFVISPGTGLRLSGLGFGCYRVDARQTAHVAALDAAIEAGCNVIDTSTNYTDGQSERLVGHVLAQRIRAGVLARDECVVVSKIGYAQGENLELAVRRAVSNRPFPQMIRYTDGLWHCVHPEWIEDQLTRALGRLGLETLDVCLLHNPEYDLKHSAQHHDGPVPSRRADFYRRIEAAFAHLEVEVTRGRIAAYGVSSNTVGAAADDETTTSLQRFIECARRVGGDDHHFRWLQLPLNLLESRGALEANTGPDGRWRPLDLAAREGITVLVNRPLNAIVGHALIRLADPPIRGRARPASSQLRRRLDALLPDHHNAPLSQKALWVLTSLPGVRSVLVGMRETRYVADAMTVLQWRPLPDADAVLRALEDATG